MPTITEQDAREALLNYVSQNCCYGKGAAEDLKFTDLKSTSAFHVRVELSGKCDTIYFQIQNNLIFTFKHTYCRIITVLVESIVLDFVGHPQKFVLSETLKY